MDFRLLWACILMLESTSPTSSPTQNTTLSSKTTVTVGCGQPTIYDGEVATPNGTLAGATASFTCNTKFVISGAAISTCTVSGWDPKPPTCKCPKLTDIPGGIVNDEAKADSTPIYGTAFYQCLNGMEAVGYVNRTCKADIGWGPQPHWPTCFCVGLTPPVDGQVDMNFERGIMAIGVPAAYQCNYGFVLNGPQMRTCTETGWDGKAPTCESTSHTSSPTQGTTLSSKTTVTIADTTHANAVSSDGILSTGVIIVISAGSGVVFTLIVVAVSFTVIRSLRKRKSKNPVEHNGPVYLNMEATNNASSHINVHEAQGPGIGRQPDNHVYQVLGPRNGNENYVHEYETVFRR